MNAIAHRDYRSTAHVQVYVYQDRVEIVTPGGLPAGMREEELGRKRVPRNPLLFSMLYRMKLVEQIGSGIRRMHDACREHGVAEPTFQVSPDWLTVVFPRQESAIAPQVAPHDTPHVGRLIAAVQGEMSRADLMIALGLADRRHFATAYLQPGIDAGLLEITRPDRPRSRAQRYRLTARGRQVRNDRERADNI